MAFRAKDFHCVDTRRAPRAILSVLPALEGSPLYRCRGRQRHDTQRNAAETVFRRPEFCRRGRCTFVPSRSTAIVRTTKPKHGGSRVRRRQRRAPQKSQPARLRRKSPGVSSEQAPQFAAQAGKLVRHAEAQQEAMAFVRQSKGRRNAQVHAIWQLPRKYRRKVMRCAAEREILHRAEPAIHFRSGHKTLETKSASPRQRGKPQRPARAQRITEFPRLVPQIFLADKILGDVPALEIAPENYFGLDLVFDLAARLRVGIRRVRVAVETYDFLHGLIRAIRIFVF